MIKLALIFDFSRIDQYTLVITITGYVIVLITLASIAYFFTRLHKIQDLLQKRKMSQSNQNKNPEPVKMTLTGEENAAIAAALFIFFSELHDEEKYVMTIRKVSKTYSPWSSKIYGVLHNMKHW